MWILFLRIGLMIAPLNFCLGLKYLLAESTLFLNFELETLRNYIDETLEKGFIRPSTSPAGAGIFIVEKDHTLSLRGLS